MGSEAIRKAVRRPMLVRGLMIGGFKMCTCMHAKYVHVQVCIYVLIHAFMRVCMHGRTDGCMHGCSNYFGNVVVM